MQVERTSVEKISIKDWALLDEFCRIIPAKVPKYKIFLRCVMSPLLDISSRASSDVAFHSNTPSEEDLMGKWENETIVPARLEHLGLLAGTMQELNVRDLTNKFLNGGRPELKLDMGLRLNAMLLNLISFQSRTLYKTSEFLEGFAYEALLDSNVDAEDFNDDSMGRLLDEIYDYGSAKFFESMAIGMLSGKEVANKKLVGNSRRMDSTSCALHGVYENQTDSPDQISITFGYSKDGRPDLKQVMLALVTTGPANLPLFAKAMSGNTSDKTEFPKIIEQFQKDFNASQAPLWIFDAAGYKKSWLEDQLKPGTVYVPWLTRVPESILEAKKTVEGLYEASEWEALSNGYKSIELRSNYGGMPQSWTLYQSEQSRKMQLATLEVRIERDKDALEKKLKKLSKRAFSCENDALRALKKTIKESKYFIYHTHKMDKSKGFSKKGRPNKGAVPDKIEHFIVGTVTENAELVAKKKRSCGRFILATNVIGALNNEEGSLEGFEELQTKQAQEVSSVAEEPSPEPQLTRSELILKSYKELSGTESCFRTLKDKEFMMNNFFLHSPERIEALMIIFALAIFVHNYSEYFIVSAVKSAGVDVRGPGNNKLKNVSLKRIFEVFHTASAVRVDKHSPYVVMRLKPVQIAILRALGPPYMSKYGMF